MAVPTALVQEIVNKQLPCCHSQELFSDSAVIAQHSIECALYLKGEDERSWCQIALYGVCR